MLHAPHGRLLYNQNKLEKSVDNVPGMVTVASAWLSPAAFSKRSRANFVERQPGGAEFPGGTPNCGSATAKNFTEYGVRCNY